MPARTQSLVWLIVMSSLMLAVVLGAVLIASAPIVLAAPIPVTTCNVSELIAAINTANLGAAADTITLTAGCIYTFSVPNNYWYGPNALPPISSTITIEGNGATLVNTNPTRLRFFYVGANPASARTPGYNTPGAGHLTLHNLTLTGGLARGGDSQWGGGGAGMGGAIFNQGALMLDQVTLRGNSARGGGSFFGTTLFGAGGMGADASGSYGGGFGGAVNPGGSVGGNNVGGGGGFRPSDNGGYVNGGGTPDGLGGQSHDAIGIGGNGSGGGSGNGGGGNFGNGGGYYGGGGVGGGGGGDNGGGGGFGGGGGYYGAGKGGSGGFGGGGGSGTPGNSGGGGGFGGGAGGSGGPSGGGGAGMGGAIFNHGGVLTLTNSTLVNNIAQGGPTDGNDSGGSGSGLGGAVFNLNGSVSIFNSTLADNTVMAGSGGTSGSAEGGALYNLRYTLNSSIPNADVTLSQTILADSVGGSDLVNHWPTRVVAAAGGMTNTGAATMLFAAPNLVASRTNSGGVFTDTIAQLVGIDPRLAPAGDYGGGAQTLALLPGSPAIDAGGGCPSTDQRGVVRPQGMTCDIGAFESQGFTLTKTGGDNQSAPVKTIFTQPLAISVTSTFSEPVNGGVVTFAGPLGGAGINPITTTATITNGTVAQGLAANGILGSFTIEVSANGAAPLTFTLQNLACVYVPLVAK